jgi:CHAT domain-containing protein
MGSIATAQTAEAEQANQQVQQGVEQYQAGDFQGAIQTWQGALVSYQQRQDAVNEAIVLENLARAYQARGAVSEALLYWEQAADRYRQMQDRQQVGRMLIEQAQAYSRLGQQRQAIALLCGSPEGEATCVESSALQIARAGQDSLGQTAALGSLGEAHRLLGNYALAEAYLQSGLETVQPDSIYSASLLNSLGNTYASLAQVSYRRADYARQAGDNLEVDRLTQEGIGQDQKALESFQAGLTQVEAQPDPSGQLRLLLDSIPSDYRVGNGATAAAKVQQANTLLSQLPDSQAKVYAMIDLVRLLQPIAPNQPISRIRCLDATIQPQAEALLQQAVATANQIGDRRSQSFALGELGHLYECQQHYAEAIDLTQQARLAAEQEPDSRYLWEWQTGRILKQQLPLQTDPQPERLKAVIAIYEKSVATLETIRSDLLTANRDLQFDFRDTVDPVYRELVELRLELEQVEPQAPQRKENITSALKTLDSLKLAELQNYFGDDCVIVPANQGSIDLAKVEVKAAVFNSVILDDRTAIIASFPDGQQQVSWLNISRERLSDEINEYRKGLERFFEDYNPQQSQRVYNWLIQPFAENLQNIEVNTLVFVQDRILRTIPMAALHDGEQFLIQKYAIATTPSLTLTNPEPLDRRNLRALALGLTESTTIDGRQFPPLDNVGQELVAVAAQLPGSKPLLNQEFTRDRLRQELDETAYPIIHIATHGEFGSEPQDTFLVTGDNQKLTLIDLDTTLRTAAKGNEIELLSLTACQTATGDDRSALGLAGVAVQAGVNSAFASLWFIDDAATAQIVEQFYAAVRDPNTSKAEALRQAQLSVIEAGGTTAHPAYWAPFILIGNWL